MKKVDIKAIVNEASEIEKREAVLRNTILSGIIELIKANGGELELTEQPKSLIWNELAMLRYEAKRNVIWYESSNKYTKGHWEIFRERSISVLAAIYEAAEKSINK